MGVGEHEPKPVQNNTLCTIMAVFVGVGKGTVDLYECLGCWLSRLYRSETEMGGTSVKRFGDQVTDTKSRPEMKLTR